MTEYLCKICGWIFSPEVGDIVSGIDPGTDFADLPDSYTCPICYAMKDKFEEIQQ